MAEQTRFDSVDTRRKFRVSSVALLLTSRGHSGWVLQTNSRATETDVKASQSAIVSILSLLLATAPLACCKPKSQSGQSSATSNAPGCVVKLAQGHRYTCGLLRDGRIQCTGLGVPTTKDYLTKEPTTLSAFQWKSTDLFAEAGTICATAEDGTLWCAGTAYFDDAVPYGVILSYDQPQKTRFHAVLQTVWSARCLVERDGVYCRELPNGRKKPDPNLRLITGLPAKVKAMSGGNSFACVVLEDGDVYCRGLNERGQLGILDGTTDEERKAERLYGRDNFTRVRALGGGAEAIDSSTSHTCALKKDGSVWCWGQNQRGQLGRGDASDCSDRTRLPLDCSPPEGLVPSQVVGLPPHVRSLALGDNISCVIQQSGSVWCWGALPNDTLRPVQLDLPEPARSVSVSDKVCVLFQSGRVACHDLSTLPLTDWSKARELRFDCR